ncbi:hypothetical protein RHI9324_04721 [Rhizobium sp. CECT 9324]|nr:hypothetical protein RHI9324_04721 [Rhizobium sp. CECT 9324]
MLSAHAFSDLLGGHTCPYFGRSPNSFGANKRTLLGYIE